MYSASVAGFTCIGIASVPRLSVSSARASGSPSPMYVAAVASARYSRCRDTASCRIIAAIGAKMIAASAPTKPSGLSSSSPPNSIENWRMLAMAAITAPIIAAIVCTSTSRFEMCAISCASTPRTCSGGRWCSRPSVTAIAEFFGLRPVAKALGCSDWIR